MLLLQIKNPMYMEQPVFEGAVLPSNISKPSVRHLEAVRKTRAKRKYGDIIYCEQTYALFLQL